MTMPVNGRLNARLLVIGHAVVTPAALASAAVIIVGRRARPR